MTAHIQVTISSINPEQQELLIALLSAEGYEGFEENENTLKAFIPQTAFDESVIKDIAVRYGISFTTDTIAQQNWNAIWEAGFQPVVVDDFVAVRASFHTPVPGVEQEIVITPKMSFGTGHHATTWLMMKNMRDIPFTGKTVFDFGTGTGVLAILAEKLGAASVVAIDNDEWSIENAGENIRHNSCNNITVTLHSGVVTTQLFDVILANINKNVILDHLAVLTAQLAAGGLLLLSGLLRDDEEDIVAAVTRQGLIPAGREEKDNWLCMRFLCL